MSNRRLTYHQSNTNCRRLADQARTIIAATLLSGGILSSGMIAWANGPAPGTVIENQATGSFVDPSDSSTKLIESNVVQVTVAEVAGITVTDNGYNEPTDGTVNEGDTVNFDFVLTNVGNDPTQFVIPGAASITNGTPAGNIQIIAYDADGTGAGAAEDLSGSDITVPSGGDNTGNLLNGVANTNNGSVPAGGSITVRVPVTAGTAGFDLTVTLGDTTVTDGQNEAYAAGTDDVYTDDNIGTANGDTNGDPINGEREASDSLTVAIAPSTPTTPTTPTAPANACELILINDSFEDPRITNRPPNPVAEFGIPRSIFIYDENDVPGWLSSADDFIEIWDQNNSPAEIPPVPTFEGNQFAEINAYVNGSLYQDVTTTPGTVMTWQFAHRGRNGVDTLNLKIGPPGATVAQINPSTGNTSFTTGNDAWRFYTGTYTVPPGQTTTRFEYVAVSTSTGNPGAGNFLDSIRFGPLCDHGDADASYPVDRGNGGAAHTMDGITYLGNTVAVELQAQPSTNADGDDNVTGDADGIDDEDGVTFTSTLEAGTTATVDIVASVAAPLSAWIDFNNNGSWDDPGEQIFTDEPLASGNNSLSFTIPATATLGDTYARFRISPQSGLAPTGIVGGGEVEDYAVAIAAPIFNISGTVYDDDNLNNTFDASEPKMPADITVRLLSSDGSVEIATTMTDANGDYSFSDIAPGTYQIQLESTDPDITVGYSLGTPNPLTVTVSSSDLTDNNFGFDNPRAGTGFSPFCVNTYGEVYVGQGGGGGNRIYAIQGDTGAVTTLTNGALAITNSLSTDFLTRTVYYAEGSGIYAWDAINDMHQRLADLNGNTNARTMPGSSGFTSLSSGGAAFYDGSLYLGVDDGLGGGGIFEIYRVDFVPGSDGKTIQSITALGINGFSAADGDLNDGDWGDFIIGDNGVIYGASGGSAEFWSYDLNTGTYTDLIDPVGTFDRGVQLAKDGQGRLFGLPNTTSGTASTIIQLQIVGNAVQTVGSSSSISPVQGYDAAECVIGRSAIGDRVWDDLDGDGIQDPLEPGIANVTVGLYRDIDADGVLDAGDPLLGTQLTNNNGNYDFVDLIFGNYIIKVLEGTPNDLDGTNLVDGAVITTANSPGGEDPVTLPTGIVDYNDADFGYQLPIIPKDPNVLLVKRITQINGSTASAGGDDLSGYIDQSEAINPYDDNDITVADPVDPTDPPKDTNLWPTPLTTSLVGGIDGGNVMPNDEIEYTIYYLSSGDATAESVLFCDYVPTFTSFISNAYTGSAPQAPGGIGGADLSIELFRNGTTDYHTGANDGDSATYFAPGVDPANSFPGIDCDGDSDGINANTNGAVVVNLGDLPDATTDTTGAYGYVRFRARVK